MNGLQTLLLYSLLVTHPKNPPLDVRFRRAVPDDRPAVVQLCRRSLGWKADDPNEAFFQWKHDENPFGSSPAWVAEDDSGSLVGLRTFLRWRFRRPDGTTFNAVRAVDTATHPDWQGKGIFRRWEQVGKVPVSVRLSSPWSVLKLAGARTAAHMWSEESSCGRPAVEVLEDHGAVEALLERLDRGSQIGTDRTPEFLHWRYRFAPLRYRAISLGADVEDGLVVFRARHRGTAVEATICEVLVPKGASVKRVWKVLKGSGVDYLLKGSSGGRLHVADLKQGFVAIPKLGPILTWRPVTQPLVPTMDQLVLGLGDVELF